MLFIGLVATIFIVNFDTKGYYKIAVLGFGIIIMVLFYLLMSGKLIVVP